MGAKKVRQSNFEMLKIIAMLLILAKHYAVFSNMIFPQDTVTVNEIFHLLITGCIHFALNVFVLISGYFLTNATLEKNYILKIIKIIGQVCFFSITLYALGCFMGCYTLSLRGLVEAVLPLTYRTWWFATAYFMLFILSPFLNMLFNKLPQKMFIILLGICTFFWSVVPTIFNKDFECNDLIYFIFLYGIAAYIKRFVEDSKIRKPLLAVAIIVILGLTYASAILVEFMSLNNPGLLVHKYRLMGKYMLPNLLTSVCLFLLVKGWNFGEKKWVNTIASGGFGVYLITEHPFIREYLWTKWLPSNQYTTESFFIIYSIGVILVVYCACTIIDLVRQHTIEKLYMLIGNKVANWGQNILNKFVSDSSESR